MGDFMELAHRVAERHPEHRRHFQELFDALPRLQRKYAPTGLDVNNIEVLMGALEMAGILGLGGDKVDDYTSSYTPITRCLHYVIAKTIEERLSFPLANNILQPPPPYPAFVELLTSLRRATRDSSSAFLTFNYDLAADFAISSKFAINYGLTRAASQGFALLKLHGSLNWFSCVECHNLVSMDFDEFPANMPMRVSERFSKWSHVKKRKHNISATPFIIPPTWDKGSFRHPMASVWAKAVAELREAQNIFIIGYSFPETDEYFRHLFTLATGGSAQLRRLWVFNPDASGVIEGRYAQMAGRAVGDRFRYFQRTFSQAIADIGDLFRPAYVP